MLGRDIQETSPIEVFNTIGDILPKDCEPIYFKSKFPKFHIDEEGRIIDDYGYLHYIHINKNGNLKVSIYFDNDSVGSLMEEPYYELYDLCDVYRYLIGEEEDLINDTMKLLNEGAK